MKTIHRNRSMQYICSCWLVLQAKAEEPKEYRSNGLVEFIPNVDPTEPVDPENPDPEKPVKPIDPTDPEGPNPGTQGPLSIDYASSFDFGKNRISNKDQVYFARAQQYQENQKKHQILCKFLIIEEPIVVGL